MAVRSRAARTSTLEDWEATLSYRAAITAHEEVSGLRIVREFRERRLPDGLFPASGSGVQAWLRRLGDADVDPDDDPTSRLGLKRFASAVRNEMAASGGGFLPEVEIPGHLRSVQIVIAERPPLDADGKRNEFGVGPVPISGTLGDLFWIGLHLADVYGWDPAIARGWLIADQAFPAIEPIVVDADPSSDPPTPNRRASRIRIEAHRDVPVARFAPEIAPALWDSTPEAPHKYPRLSKPIARSIVCATWFSVLRNDGRAWVDVLEEWNAWVPSRALRYPSTSEGPRRLARDARRTYQTLVGRPLEWQHSRGKPRGSSE